MPLWGLWYRPWLRRATYALFVSVSIFSMVMGFYDLLKNVPFLHQARRPPAGRAETHKFTRPLRVGYTAPKTISCASHAPHRRDVRVPAINTLFRSTMCM